MQTRYWGLEYAQEYADGKYYEAACKYQFCTIYVRYFEVPLLFRIQYYICMYVRHLKCLLDKNVVNSTSAKDSFRNLNFTLLDAKMAHFLSKLFFVGLESTGIFNKLKQALFSVGNLLLDE